MSNNGDDKHLRLFFKPNSTAGKFDNRGCLDLITFLLVIVAGTVAVLSMMGAFN